jgi:hypothetical protein
LRTGRAPFAHAKRASSGGKPIAPPGGPACAPLQNFFGPQSPLR